jgi:hypothetical protein
MDIEEFYDQDPMRRASEEVEYGTDWSDANGGRAELSWIAETGELYVMAEPVEPMGSDGIGDLYVQNLPTEALTVEVLGTFETKETLEQALAGWEAAMTQPNSLEWVRARVT